VEIVNTPGGPPALRVHQPSYVALRLPARPFRAPHGALDQRVWDTLRLKDRKNEIIEGFDLLSRDLGDFRKRTRRTSLARSVWESHNKFSKSDRVSSPSFVWGRDTQTQGEPRKGR
jgi:hypothetical protein